MNYPLVTIGIPCYNVEKFIRFSIASVLKQSYSNFELIITDDGSTDNTLNVIKQFKDDRIILVSDGENHGISYRLNQQIDMAKGDFFIRMDGDDIMFPDRVEKQIKFLMEHPDVDVLGTPAVIIDDDNNIIGYRENSFVPRKPIDMLNHVPFIHPTVAGRLSFFKKHYYDVDLCGVEDNDLWCRGLADNAVYGKLNEPLMFYREPLKFKLKTYLFRTKQSRKQIKKRKHLYINKFKMGKKVFTLYMKEIIVKTASFMQMDELIIKRRQNGTIDSQYSNILNSIIE